MLFADFFVNNDFAMLGIQLVIYDEMNSAALQISRLLLTSYFSQNWLFWYFRGVATLKTHPQRNWNFLDDLWVLLVPISLMYQTNLANYGKLTKLNTIVAIGVKEKGGGSSYN